MPAYTQDMPPKGGYAPIEFIREIKKTPRNGLLAIGALYCCTFLGLAYQSCVRERRDAIVREDQEARIALTPFIMAEQERLYLKQLRRNRDFEVELMSDVPGWKVGHWHDYPIYHNPRGMWCDPNFEEFYAHTSRRFRQKRLRSRIEN